MDIFAQIYPVVLPGIQDKESNVDKRELCIQGLNAIQSITNATRSKTLRFKNHSTIEDSRQKFMAIYQPLKNYYDHFLPGYQVADNHCTTTFSMNYREYHQHELYLLLNDIYWVSLNIKLKFVFDCIQYKN